jgi:O-antigen/teichoic acid export membrane protein
MRSRAARASAVIVFGHAGIQLLRMGSNLVATRLLFPDAFGVMALVYVLMTGLEMLSDVGVEPSIVQHPRGRDRSFQDTAWTVQVFRGLVLWAVAAALAVPYARFYGEPELAAIVPIAAASAALSGFNSTKLAALKRELTLGRVVVIDVCAQIAAIAAMLSVAAVYRSLWALVVGGLMLDLVRMLMSHIAIPGPRNRFRWEPDAARSIVHFGKWIFLSSLVTFAAARFDVMMLGRLLPASLLGVYSIANVLAALPQEVTGRLIGFVHFPAMAESARRGDALLRENLARARAVLLPAVLAVVLGIALFAPAFFTYLYDPRYHAAGWMTQLLMVKLWFYMLHEIASRTLLAVGDSRSLALGNAVRLVATVIGCASGWAIGGFPGLVLGAGAGAFAGYLTVSLAARAQGLFLLRGDLITTAVGVGLGLVGGLTPHLAASRLGGVDPALVGLPLGAAILAPVVLVALRRLRAPFNPRTTAIG